MIHSFAESTRTLTSMFGLNTSTEYPKNLSGLNSEVKSYLAGSSGIGVVIGMCGAAIIVFVLLYGIFACCACCQKSPSVSTCQTFCHFVFLSLMIISVVCCLSAHVLISQGLSELPGFSNKMKNLTDSMKEAYVSSVEAAKNMAETAILNGEFALNNFSILAGTDYTTAKASATTLSLAASAMSASFSSGGAFNSVAQTFDNDYDDVTTACYPPFDPVPSVSSIVADTSEISSAADSVNDLSADFSSLDTIATDFKADNFVSIKNRVEAYEQELEEVHNELDVDVSIPNTSFIGDYTGYITNGTLWLSLGLIAITFLLGVCYFLNNGCSRCTFTLYWILAILVVAIVIVPGVLFGAAFIPLYESCENLETVILPNESFPSFDPNATFFCATKSGEKRLYYTMGFNTITDINSSLNSLRDQLHPYIRLFGDYSSIKDRVDAILALDSSLEVEALFGLDPMQIIDDKRAHIEEVYDTSSTAQCDAAKTAAGRTQTDFIQKLDNCESSLADELDRLADMRTDAGVVYSWASRIQDTFHSTKSTIEDFRGGLIEPSRQVLSEGINEFTCLDVCTIYIPARNGLCSNMLDGVTLWVIASFLTTPSLFGLAITTCLRRQSMVPIKQKPVNNSSVNSRRSNRKSTRLSGRNSRSVSNADIDRDFNEPNPSPLNMEHSVQSQRTSTKSVHIL